MSFSLHAEKTQLVVHGREPITSGSVNVYTVRFDFSEDWEGMEKTATFRFHSQSVSTALDENNRCVIPWEIIDHYEPNMQLFAGVCGTKNGEVVLPTIWASLGTLLEGTTYGRNARPPTPDLLEQRLEQKQDKLKGEPGQYVGFDEDGNAIAQDFPEIGSGGATEHEELDGRDKPDQHPIEAITGLTDELNRIPEPMTKEDLEALLGFGDIDPGEGDGDGDSETGGKPSGGDGTSGTTDHRKLYNRDADNQHPVSAIEGLQDILDTIPRPMTAMELRIILLS